MKPWPDKNQDRSEAGFTLAEMIVAVSIFVITVAAIITAFMSVVRAQNRAEALRVVGEDARYSMEQIARGLRLAKVDYAALRGLPAPFYRDMNGIPEIYYLDENENQHHIYVRNDAKLMIDDQAITPNDIQITDLRFYISPNQSPYAGGSENSQSRVTIVLSSQLLKKEQPVEGSDITLQTTVSSRVYDR